MSIYHVNNFEYNITQIITNNINILDITILVAGIGSQSDYSDLVTNTQKDVSIIQQVTNEEQLKIYGQSVVNSIKNGSYNMFLLNSIYLCIFHALFMHHLCILLIYFIISQVPSFNNSKCGLNFYILCYFSAFYIEAP